MLSTRRHLTTAIVFSTVLILSGCNLLTQVPTSAPSETTINQSDLTPVDHHASFAVFVHGKQRVLDHPQYFLQSDSAYLDSHFPGTIFIKLSPLIWSDFFATIPINLSSGCLQITLTRETLCTGDTDSLKFFLNGTITSSITDRTIEDGDRLLISFGHETGIDLERQVNRVPTPTFE